MWRHMCASIRIWMCCRVFWICRFSRMSCLFQNFQVSLLIRHMIFICFHMTLYDFHMILYGFYMILHCFYMILYDLYMILNDFTWFLGGVAEIYGWPVFLNFNVFLDFERSTGHSNDHRNFRMTLFSEFRYKKQYKKSWIYVMFYEFDMILYGFGKILKNLFGYFLQFFYNIWCFWPRYIDIHIRKIKFASTRNSGSPFLGFKLNFLIFIFSERPTGIPNVRPEIRTFDRNFERSTGILNVRPEFPGIPCFLPREISWFSRISRYPLSFLMHCFPG